jgi:hypothetical protein
VATKRKELTVFHWDDDSKFIHFVDLVVPDVVRAMEWAGQSLCVGFKREYVLIRVLTGAMSEIFPVGKRCFMCLLPHREMLLGKESHGICVDFEGKPTRKEPIVWSAPPEAICYHHPFILAMLPNGIEVRNKETRSLTQMTKFAKGTLMTRKQHLFAASLTAITYLAAVPLVQQVDELVMATRFKEAVALVESSHASNWDDEAAREAKKTELHTLFSYHLFNTAEYQEAMRYFHLTNCNPRQILSLFPDVLPTGAQLRVQHPVRVQRIQGENGLLLALSALIPYLAYVRGRIMLQDEGNSSNSLINKDLDDSNGADAMPLTVLVDTVLLKAYLLTDGNLVMPFLQRAEGNNCDIDDSQNILRIYEKYEEMVCLYQCRGMHRSALELLQKLGQDDRNPDKALQGTSHTVRYLQYLITSSTPENQNEHFALVLDFSRWVLRRDPEEGLRVFTSSHGAPSTSTEGRMPSEIALDQLKKSADPEVCIAFLESLVAGGDTEPMFHNELIFMYLSHIRLSHIRL